MQPDYRSIPGLRIDTSLTQGHTNGRRERTNFEHCKPPRLLGKDELPTKRESQSKVADGSEGSGSHAPVNGMISLNVLPTSGSAGIEAPADSTHLAAGVFAVFVKLAPHVDSSLLGRIQILIRSSGVDADEILKEIVPRIAVAPGSLNYEALKHLERFCIVAGANALSILKVIDEVSNFLGREIAPFILFRIAADLAGRIGEKPIRCAEFCRELVYRSEHIDDPVDRLIGGFSNGMRLWESWQSDQERTAEIFLEFRSVPGISTGLFVRYGLGVRSEDATTLYRTAIQIGRELGDGAVAAYFDAIDRWTETFGQKSRPQLIHILGAFHLQRIGQTADKFFAELIPEFGTQRIKDHLTFLRGALTRFPDRLAEFDSDIPNLADWAARIPKFTGKMEDRILNYVLLGLHLNVHEQRNPIKKDEARLYATWKEHVPMNLPSLYTRDVERTFIVTVTLPEDDYTISPNRDKPGREKLLATLYRICRPATFRLLDATLREMREKLPEVEVDGSIRGTPKELQQLFIAAAQKSYSKSFTRDDLKWATKLVVPFLPIILGTELPELPFSDYSIGHVLDLQQTAKNALRPFQVAPFRRHYEAWIPVLNVAMVLMLQKAGVARSVIDDIKEFSPLTALTRELKHFVPKSYRTVKVPVTIIAERTVVDAFHDDMTQACLERMGAANQIKRGDFQPARIVVDWPAEVSHLVGRPKGKEFSEIIGCWYSGIYPTVLRYKPHDPATYHITKLGGGVLPHYEDVFDRPVLYRESLKVFDRWIRTGRFEGRVLSPELLAVLGDSEAYDANLKMVTPRDQWTHGWRTAQDGRGVELVRAHSGKAQELHSQYYIAWPEPNPDFGPAKWVTRLRIPTEDRK